MDDDYCDDENLALDNVPLMMLRIVLWIMCGG
jgi:hypothetical protein